MALGERVKVVYVVYKEAIASYHEVVMLRHNLSKETDRTQEEICSRECVFDTELESSASFVRQQMLLVFIYIPSDMLLCRLGFRVREGGPFPLPCLILCFPPTFLCYLVAFCSNGISDDGATCGKWPITDFGEMIVLVFLYSIFSALVGVCRNRGNE